MQNSNDLILEEAHVDVLSRSAAMGAPNVGGAPAILKYALTSQQKYYFYRPEEFIMDCFEWGSRGPTGYQLTIARSLPIEKRIAVRGPHSLGKTSVASWLIHWFALTRDGEDWKIPTTATAWRQLTKFLWPEIHKWARKIRWDKIGRDRYTDHELLQRELKLRTGEAFAAASNDVQKIEGAHADYLFYLFDEAKAIPESTFDGSEGAFAAGTEGIQEAYALAISTPGEPIGRFYDIHRRKAGLEEWHPIHVTLEDAISAKRISRDWADSKRRLWGEQSALYQNRVEGNFYAGDEEGIIPIAWIEAANDRWEEWKESGSNHLHFTCVGVDVARSGEANTVLALRFEQAISEIRAFSKEDTMETSGRVTAVLRSRGGYASIDVIGVGSGVVDKVREDKFDVKAFNAGSKCEAKDRTEEFGFTNLRSAAWWHMREMLDPMFGATIMLPPDDELTQDLTTPRWRVKSGGKIEVESKGETEDGGKGVIQRLGRSTDKGDAVVMAFCPKAWMEIANPKAIWIAV